MCAILCVHLILITQGIQGRYFPEKEYEFDDHWSAPLLSRLSINSRCVVCVVQKVASSLSNLSSKAVIISHSNERVTSRTPE